MTCVYCRTTSNARGAVLELRRELPEDSEPPEDEWERRAWEYERDKARKTKAWEDFKEEVAAKEHIDLRRNASAMLGTRRDLSCDLASCPRFVPGQERSSGAQALRCFEQIRPRRK